MTRRAAILLPLAAAIAGAVVVDRIAVIVGKHAIKLSDIDRDLRVTEFLNRTPLSLSPGDRRKAAERLIDQSLIADEISIGGYARPTEQDAAAMLNRIRQDRYAGSESRFTQGLAVYGFTEDQLQRELFWQLEVLRFIDQRFRPGVLISDDDIRDYYNQHRAELARQYPQAANYNALAPKIREQLEGERINQNFTQWLARARQRNRIEYRQGAFQ